MQTNNQIFKEINEILQQTFYKKISFDFFKAPYLYKNIGDDLKEYKNNFNDELKNLQIILK